MQQFKQSESTAARRRFYLHLVDAGDGITPETGEAAGQPQVSKNGAGFVNTSATLTAIGNGAYYVELTADELGTLGVVLVRYKSANTAEFQDIGYVLAFDPYDADGLGLSRLDVAISTRSTLTQADILSDATPFAGADVAGVKAKTDNLPADPASESGNIAAVKSKTDNLPADPADQATSDAIKAKTDLIPDDIGDIPTDAELSAKHGAGSWETAAEFKV